MILNLNLLVLLVFMSIYESSLFSQATHPKSNFETYYKNECFESSREKPVEIFRKIMTEPVLKSHSEKSFFNRIQQLCLESDIKNQKEIVITIAFLIILEQNICVSRITADSPIPESLVTSLRSEIESITEFEYGRQMGVPKHNQCGFALRIKRGKLKSLEKENVVFER